MIFEVCFEKTGGVLQKQVKSIRTKPVIPETIAIAMSRKQLSQNVE